MCCCSGSSSTKNKDEVKESMRRVDEILEEIKESREIAKCAQC